MKMQSLVLLLAFLAMAMAFKPIPRSARQNMHDGVMPTNEIKGGIFLLISGLLLITPGFFTDCIGFAIFLKPVQDFISQHAKNYFISRTRRY